MLFHTFILLFYLNLQILNAFHGIHAFKVNRKHSFQRQVEMKSVENFDSRNVLITQKKSLLSNIPNILTISRILAIPPFVATFVLKQKSISSLIFIVSCLTDMLDGFLARKFSIVSNFGIFLDPVADKLMVVTALILLVTKIPVWWFAISVVTIICREISVSALRDWMAQKGHNVTIEVSKLGKIKTAMQMISIVILLEASPGANILQFDILSYSPVPKPVTFLIGLLLFFASTILTVFSGMQYLIASWPFLVAPNV